MTHPTRKEIAQSIINSPELYKVCEVCGSIISEQSEICPNCNAYRFNGDSEFVVEQAVLLASREQKSVSPDDLT